MPGKLYMNSVRLSRAYSEGFEAEIQSHNPHPQGTPAYHAWEEGFLQPCPGEEHFYGGVAEHTGNYWCGPDRPVQNPIEDLHALVRGHTA